MEVVVRNHYTPQQVRKAELKAMEFRPGRYTSGSANLDDMIALGKAVILCQSHTRKFQPKAAHYRAHPDKRMRRVNGCCDACRQFELCFLFLPEKLADDEQKKVEKFKRAVEYGHFYNG